MHLFKLSKAAIVMLSAALLSAAQLSADVVETKNGARIVGQVTKDR